MDPARITAAVPFFISALLILGTWAGQKVTSHSLKAYINDLQDRTAPGVAPPRLVRACIPTELRPALLIPRIEQSFDAAGAFAAGLAMVVSVAGSSLPGLTAFQPLLFIVGAVMSFFVFVVIHTADPGKYTASRWTRWKLLTAVQVAGLSMLGIWALVG